MNVLKVIDLLKKEYPHSKLTLNFSNPLELLIATSLAARSKDKKVNEITKTLFRRYKTAKDYANANLKELEKEVREVNFYKNKAKNIKEACKILVEKYNGKVPKNVDELISLPGVGRKTAIVVLTNSYKIPEGIEVDTHIARVSQRLGLTKNSNPEKIEKDLMNLIPKKDWFKFTHIVKDHGRAICRAPVPICSKCVLNKLCPKNGVIKKL